MAARRRARRPPRATELVEDAVVDLEVVVAADEARGAGGLDLVAVADVAAPWAALGTEVEIDHPSGEPVKGPLESAFLTRAMPLGLDMVIGSVKRKYDRLPPDHPAMKCGSTSPVRILMSASR